VVQKVIEFTKERLPLQKEIIELIEPYSLYLIENINGNHVMQKCFEVIHLSNIIKVVIDNVTFSVLSIKKYRCTPMAAESFRNIWRNSMMSKQ